VLGEGAKDIARSGEEDGWFKDEDFNNCLADR